MGQYLLQPGDVFAAIPGMPVSVREPDGMLKYATIGDTLLGDYVVEEVFQTEAGDWFVTARRLRNGRFDPSGAALRFYQNGHYLHTYLGDIIPKRRMHRVYV